MSSAILVCTHGHTSGYMIKTAEMIVGKQENIGFVNFVPGEGTEDLGQKYRNAIKKLECSHGVLVMVDMFGGSPFNAIATLAYLDENMEVITGVNVPMLVEIFILRESLDLKGLLERAKTAGINGITTLEKNLINEVEMEDEL